MKSNQSKYANLNLNAALTAKPGGPQGGPGGPSTNGSLTKGGLLLLSKRPRTATGVKLSVPKPVNLPSIKKEHAGNDPTTQLVPASGGSGTWSKPGEESGQPGGPGNASITAVSNWASTQGAPPAPQPRPSPHTDRLLNPEEYPSLAASAKAEANAAKHAKVPSQDYRAWADDDRAPSATGGWRAAPDWNSRADDERYVGDSRDFRAWEQRSARFDDFDERGGPRGRYDSGFAPRAFGEGPPPPPPPRRGGYDRNFEGYGAFDPFEDRSLFPPPPPPRTAQPADAEEEDDPERRAFEAELQRVAADLERRKLEERGESRGNSRGGSIAERREPEKAGLDGDEAPSQSDSVTASDTEACAHGAAAQRVPSRFGAEDDDDVRRRRERASEKLRRLEMQMASRASGAADSEAAVESTHSAPPSAWKRLPKEEDLAWDDERRTQSRRDDADPDPRPGSARQPSHISRGFGAPAPPPRNMPAPPPPPPPPQQQQQPESATAWQHQRPPLAPALMDRMPPPAPVPIVQQRAGVQPLPSSQSSAHSSGHHNHQQPRVGAPAAMFGSFDDDLFEELNKAPMPAQEVPAATPRPWYPSEGTPPTVLRHAAPAQVHQSASQQPQQQQQQQPQQQHSLDAGVGYDGPWRQEAAARPGSASDRGRGRGRSSRGGRSGNASESDTGDMSGSARGSGRGAHAGRGAGALQRGRGPRGRGPYGNGAEGEGEAAADSWGTGEQRWGGSRAGRGQRGATRNVVVPFEDSEGDTAGRAGKVPRLGRAEGPSTSASQLEDSNPAFSQLCDAGLPEAPTAASAAAPAAGAAPTHSTSSTVRSAAGWAPGTSLVPAPSSSMATAAAPATEAPTLAVLVPGLSLNDPVLTTQAFPKAALSFSPPMDPAPGAATKAMGFDRQVGPKTSGVSKGSPMALAAPAAGPPPPPSVSLRVTEASPPVGAELSLGAGSQAVGSGGNVLENSIIALPADLTLDVAPSLLKHPQNQHQQASSFRPSAAPPVSAPSAASIQGRPTGGPFAFGPATSGAMPGAGGAAPPPGIAAMWEGSKVGAQGQTPAAPPTMAWPSVFPASAAQVTAAANGPASSQGAQLMFSTHFGFNAPPPPQRFVSQQAPFGGLATNANWQTQQQGQQPFLPSNKPPDWSIGPQSPTLGALGGLGMPGTSFAVGTSEGQQLVAGAAASNGNMVSGYGAALGPPPAALGFAMAPPGHQPHARAMQQGKPGNSYGLGPGQVPNKQPRGVAAAAVPPPPPPAVTSTSAAAVANLPDDIFDSKPGPASSGNRNSGAPAQPGRMVGPGEKAHGRNSGGRGGRGRGGRMGSSGDAEHAADMATSGMQDISGRDGGGRGFSGRNGRGAGRSSAVAAAAAAAAALAAAATGPPPPPPIIAMAAEVGAPAYATFNDGTPVLGGSAEAVVDGGRGGRGNRGARGGGRNSGRASGRGGRGTAPSSKAPTPAMA